MEIGNRIKSARKKEGLTQKQLAEILNVSTITIQNYENNRRKPNIDMINKIAEALGVSQHKLITGKSLSEIVEEVINSTDEIEKAPKKIVEKLSKLSKSDVFTLENVDEMFYSTVFNILSTATENSTLGYKLSDFSGDEVNEISNFVFNSYKLKVNEILERHNQEK